jgi:hypothetical protein
MNVLESRVEYGGCQAAKISVLRSSKTIPAEEAILPFLNTPGERSAGSLASQVSAYERSSR